MIGSTIPFIVPRGLVYQHVVDKVVETIHEGSFIAFRDFITCEVYQPSPPAPVLRRGTTVSFRGRLGF